MSIAQERTGRQTIGLSMIVRDAASTIENSLASALPYIDAWTVVDTGSEDTTVELVQWMLRGVPGALHRRPWLDFGTNRSEALRLARRSADYLLVLDADETISGSPLPALWMDGYDVGLVDGERWEPRIIRADLPWRFLGAARDRLSCAVPVARSRLSEATIHSHQTPEGRAVALERDALLLRASLEDDPTDLLSWFKLGLVVLELGDAQEARTLFEHCLASAAWDELTFCSAHQLARITVQDDLERGMWQLLEAWDLRPSRIEPLFDLAKLANGSSRPTRALLATSVGIALKEPADDLMVQPWIYRWRMRLEHAVSLRLVGRTPEAIRVVDKLIADPALPNHLLVDSLAVRQSIVDAAAEAAGTRPQPEDVSVADLGAVPLLTGLVGKVATVEVGLPLDEPWLLTGASMAGGETGFALQLTVADAPAAGPVARLRHFLQLHDATGAPLSVREILHEVDRVALGLATGGFDEARLFRWEDAWWCLGSRHPALDDERGETFLVGLGSNGSAPTAVRAQSPAFQGPHRNLMPVVVNGRLFVVTRLDPFEVLAWDRTGERFEAVTRVVSAPGLAGWIGGSPGLRTADGFLFVIRRVRAGDRFELATHRFLALDERLCPVAASPEFVFQRYGTEACLGLARCGQDLMCTYASGQGRGWITAVRYDVVTSGLLPLAPQR